MAVAEAMKMEKGESGSAETPDWGSGPLGWFPRKYAEFKTFFSEVMSELKKVTWPGREEVYNTTLVVIATTVFFGFYLWGLDLVLTRAETYIFKNLR